MWVIWIGPWATQPPKGGQGATPKWPKTLAPKTLVEVQALKSSWEAPTAEIPTEQRTYLIKHPKPLGKQNVPKVLPKEASLCINYGAPVYPPRE